MLEHVRRYAPPPQRNRVLNRRKSGEKNQPSYLRNLPAVDHGESGYSNIQNENSHSRMIFIDGCCSSEAAQLLSDRWAAAMHSYSDQTIDLSERPIMYSGSSGSSWGHLKLPHQLDFLAELHRPIHNANVSTGPSAGDRR